MTPLQAAAMVVFAAAVSGCAGGPRSSEAAQAGASARSILLLPLNVAVTLPEELRPGSDRVWESLSVYLAERGRHVQTIAFDDARRQWLDGIQRIQSGERTGRANFETAARILVQELGRELDFDAVILPSLFVQQADLSGRRARWDGVTRRVETDREVRRIGSVVTTSQLVGTTPAASLHVVVLDADGDTLHEAQAGLELLLWMTVEGRQGAPAHELRTHWEPRANLFESVTDVREGVVRALDPFLPPLPEAP